MAEDKTEKVRAAFSSGASTAKSAVLDLFTAPAEPVDIDFGPFYPKSGLTLSERIEAAKNEIQPWSKFASGKSLGFPSSFAAVKPRYSYNISKYFYNYFAIFLADLAISGMLHRVDAVLTLGLIVLLFIAFEDDIPLFGNVSIGTRTKGIMVGVASIITLFFGGVISFIFHSLIVGSVIFAIHGLLRKTDDDAVDIEAASSIEVADQADE